MGRRRRGDDAAGRARGAAASGAGAAKAGGDEGAARQGQGCTEEAPAQARTPRATRRTSASSTRTTKTTRGRGTRAATIHWTSTRSASRPRSTTRRSGATRCMRAASFFRHRRVDGVLTCCVDSVDGVLTVRLDAVAASTRTDGTAYQRRRAAVQDHVAAMRSRASSSTSSFRNEALGWRVALARYGESGRRFVVVDSTERGSACFDSVKPGDELCAVNGAAVVDPDEESIETLKSAIANAPRPLVITFIEGEDRDTLFAAQEAQRGGTARPRKAPPATKKRADIYSAPKDAQLVIVDRDAQYRGHICEDGWLPSKTPRGRGYWSWTRR